MDGDDPFAAESKYSLLTELLSWLRDDDDWLRTIEDHLTRAVSLSNDNRSEDQVSSKSTVEHIAEEYSHGLYESYIEYQDILEQRLDAFIQDHADEGLSRETLLNQLSHISQSDDRFSASQLQLLIYRCTSFNEYLSIIQIHNQELKLAREAAADMGF